MDIKRADWVRCRYGGPIGFVFRVARDGKWADVRWRSGNEEWTKRMRTMFLMVEHTIPIGEGWTVTDCTRKRELKP